MSRWLKAAVSVALIVLLAFAVDWPDMWRRLHQVEWWAAAVALIGYTVQLFVSAWKWQWALIIHALRFPFDVLSRVYLIGFFLNNFLPSSIGGDAYRVYRTMPAEGYRSRAFSAVLLERVVGLAVLLAIGGICAALLLEYAFARTFLSILIAGGVVALVGVLMISSRHGGRMARRLLDHPRLAPLTHNLSLLRRGGRAYVPLIAISLLFQLQSIGINYILFAGTGAEVSFATCAVITAVAGLATIIPLSINGIGILEGAFAGSAIAMGVTYEHAILVAVLIRVLVLPLSLLSGLLYAWDEKTPPRRESPESKLVRS